MWGNSRKGKGGREWIIHSCNTFLLSNYYVPVIVSEFMEQNKSTKKF